MHSFLASQTPIIFSYILLQLITEGDVDLILLPWLDWFSLHESRRSFAWCLFQVTLCYLVPINIPIFIPNKKETKFFILLIGSTANLYNQLFTMSDSTTHSLPFYLPDQICNSPYCQPYNSYNASSENLVLDQLIIPKLIFLFILITYLVDIVLIL